MTRRPFHTFASRTRARSRRVALWLRANVRVPPSVRTGRGRTKSPVSRARTHARARVTLECVSITTHRALRAVRALKADVASRRVEGTQSSNVETARLTLVVTPRTTDDESSGSARAGTSERVQTNALGRLDDARAEGRRRRRRDHRRRGQPSSRETGAKRYGDARRATREAGSATLETRERIGGFVVVVSRARRLACEACERVEESLRRGALRGGHGTKED